MANGILTLDRLAEILGVSEEVFNSTDYQTLGGFLMDKFGLIPKVGDRLDWNQWTFEVHDMDGNRVNQISISLLS